MRRAATDGARSQVVWKRALDGCDGEQDLPVAPVSHLIWAIGVAGVAVPAYHAALRGVVRSVEIWSVDTIKK